MSGLNIWGTKYFGTALQCLHGESRIGMAARMLQRFKPTLPEKWKGGKIEKIGRCMLLIQQ